MEKRPVREQIADGVFFTHIGDAKFKHNRLSVNFIAPLSHETAAQNAVLPFLMRRGCKSCPDFTELGEKLCGLYGAALDSGVSKYNGYQLLNISIRAIDNRFALESEDITAQCAELLSDIVLEPKLDGEGRFYEEDLALERQFLIDTIEAEINDKRAYALQQCIAAMCGDEPVAVRRYGHAEDAAAITPESAAGAWERLVKTARVEITFTGSGEPGRARELFRKRLGGVQRTPHPVNLIALRDRADSVREITEKMELHQAKLVMGLRCAGISSPEELAAARVFSAMLGGTPFSKLFMNVREKLSLCYYCSAYFDISNKLLFIDSGVERENAEAARAEILRQLETMREADFTADELANTKLLMQNSIMSVTDTLSSLETWYLTRILRGLDATPEEDCAAIDAVPGERVAEIARGVTLDTVYSLTDQ